jgi:hypothetical protein
MGSPAWLTNLAGDAVDGLQCREECLRQRRGSRCRGACRASTPAWRRRAPAWSTWLARLTWLLLPNGRSTAGECSPRAGVVGHSGHLQNDGGAGSREEKSLGVAADVFEPGVTTGVFGSRGALPSHVGDIEADAGNHRGA